MTQGGGIAMFAVTIMVLLLLLESNIISATKFKVGDTGGWRPGIQNWATGKTFHVGDILEFNYPPEKHNVVVVDENSYNACKVPDGAKTYQTGHDKIVLNKGKNFFICGFPKHCENGMKLEIVVQ